MSNSLPESTAKPFYKKFIFRICVVVCFAIGLVFLGGLYGWETFFSAFDTTLAFVSAVQFLVSIICFMIIDSESIKAKNIKEIVKDGTILFLIFFIINLTTLIPYKLYKNIKNENSKLIEKYDASRIDTVVNQDLLDYYIGSKLMDNLGARGKYNFNLGNEFLKISIRDFERSYEIESNNSAIPGFPDEKLSTTWPYYAIAKVRNSVLDASNAQMTENAYEQFRAYIEETTNKINRAIINKDTSTFFVDDYSLQVMTGTLAQIQFSAPLPVIDSITNAISTITEMKHNPFILEVSPSLEIKKRPLP